MKQAINTLGMVLLLVTLLAGVMKSGGQDIDQVELERVVNIVTYQTLKNGMEFGIDMKEEFSQQMERYFSKEELDIRFVTCDWEMGILSVEVELKREILGVETVIVARCTTIYEREV